VRGKRSHLQGMYRNAPSVQFIFKWKKSSTDFGFLLLNCIFLCGTPVVVSPDPDSEYGSGSTDPFESGSNWDPDPDPDPKPCFFSLKSDVNVPSKSNKRT
jgi:hypothetical protein